MSEDTPEKVDDQPEEPAAKKKTARKRSKAPEPQVEEKSAGEAKHASEVVSEEKPAAREDSNEQGNSPALEDGETPTENPSVRRISSKRKSSSESSEGEDSPDQNPSNNEPPTGDGQGKKRRRRRRKGPGDGDEGGDESRQGPRPSSRIQLDPEKVEKKAWKIFLSEVSEEGLALVSDQDAKEIGRRSFRLAEIFLEEATKRQ